MPLICEWSMGGCPIGIGMPAAGAGCADIGIDIEPCGSTVPDVLELSCSTGIVITSIGFGSVVGAVTAGFFADPFLFASLVFRAAFLGAAFFDAGFAFVGMAMPGMFMCCADTGVDTTVSASALAAR